MQSLRRRFPGLQRQPRRIRTVHLVEHVELLSRLHRLREKIPPRHFSQCLERVVIDRGQRSTRGIREVQLHAADNLILERAVVRFVGERTEMRAELQKEILILVNQKVLKKGRVVEVLITGFELQ